MSSISRHVSATARIRQIVIWALSLWIAYIFVWYLQYKFTGHPGSVDLFTTLTDWLGFHGHEKAMRIGTGSVELVASILLIVPATRLLGAALSIAIMTGAIFFHLVSPLGIDPYGDGGKLFKEAISVWMAGTLILILLRSEVMALATPLLGRFRLGRTA